MRRPLGNSPRMTTMFAKILRRLGLGRADADVPPEADAIPHADLSAIPGMVEAGRIGEAETQLRHHLARDPDNVDALHFLGLVCHRDGRHAEASLHIGAAVQRAPTLAFLRANLAEALRAAGDLVAAEAAARAALRLDPHQAAARFNLAMILASRRAHTEALAIALDILKTNPEWPEALTLAANIYIALDDRASAAELLDRALTVRPDDANVLVLALRNRAWLCDWGQIKDGDEAGRLRAARADFDAFTAMLAHWAANPRAPAFQSLNPFVTYEYPVAQNLRDTVTQGYADAVLDRVKHLAIPQPSSGPAASSTRLRIGYVSADFHRHPTMHLMRSFFALHDRRRFDIFAYSIGQDDGSDYRRDAIAGVDHFIDIGGETPLQSAERMRRDGIDILVDLKGYTHEARPEIFALRPAPVRVAWLGYPASTGRGINDYVIVDRVVAPPEHQSKFGEQLVWMPHSYQVNDHRQAIDDETPPRSALGLPETGFVFACFNHLYKIEARMFAVWMRILSRTEGSVLWLYESNSAARANLEKAASAQGVAPGRLVFGGTMAKPQHLARMRRADLFLDTLWINAHTGASDALWAGVPVLTCPQDAFPSRVAASLVTAAGLPHMACASLADYEEVAVNLASRPGELAAMRQHLEGERQRLPLFDTPRFVRNIENAFETMWQRKLSGEKPRAFAVVEGDNFRHS
jgi:protein O-GlcNAc transferase